MLAACTLERFSVEVVVDHTAQAADMRSAVDVDDLRI